MSKTTKPFTTRFDEKKLNKAQRMGLNVAELFRDKLDEVLGESACPTCGSSLVNKRKPKKTTRRKTEETEDLL